MKPSRLTVLTRPYRHARGEHLGVAVACMATLGEAPRVLSEPSLWNTVGSELGGQAMDLALPKRHAEYLATAWAFGRYCNDQHACEAGLRVGHNSKRLRVSGERVWQDGAPGPAAGFDRLPLDWTLAYGGQDYPANPAGRGHEAQAHPDVAMRLLPNVEYADDPMTPSGAPVRSASFAPVPSSWPQRRELYGEIDDRWIEEDAPGFPRTMDAAYFNIAPADQQFPDLSELPAGCDYEIVNLHPERARIEGRVPALGMRAFAWRSSPATCSEIAMRLTTLWFLPHVERVVMIFHGVIPIRSFDASDISCLLLGAEPADLPRPAGHYHEVYALRMDPRRGVLHALRDGDLFPEAMAAEGDTVWSPGQPNAMARQLLNRLERESKALGAAPGSPAAPSIPASPDRLVEFVEQTEKEAEQKIADLRKRAEAIVAPLREIKPPEPAAPPVLPSSVSLDASLLALRQKAQLQGAQFRPARPHPGAAMATTLREQVLRWRTDGTSMVGADLAGADLSGLDLSGADLTLAILEGADLSNTRLTGARLRQVNLVRAHMRGTGLSNADLGEANLSLTACETVDFRGASLQRSVIEQSSFEQCDFSGATFDRTQFSKCRFSSNTFREATLNDVVMMEQEIGHADFSGAVIRKLVLMQSRSQSLDFTGADIIGFGLIETRIEQQLCFARARLKKACFLKCGALHASAFPDADLEEVNLHEADLARSDFTRARLSNCDLSDAKLQASTFFETRFTRGYLVRADLRAASLQRADLIGALLRAADLRGADLREANLFRANLGDVLRDDETRLDDAYQERTVWCPRAQPESA